MSRPDALKYDPVIFHSFLDKKVKEKVVEATKKKTQDDSPPPELLEQCRKEVGTALMRAVKILFDDEANGGDFYAHILMQMDRVFDDPRIPTAAVSATNKLNLYINSYFFVHLLGEDLDLATDQGKKLLNQRRAMVIKHEMLHCIFHHLSRGKDFGNRILANIAADLVVNSCIDSKIMGDQFLYPSKFNLPIDKSLDWYYKNYPMDDYPICEKPNEHDKQHRQKGQGQNQEQQKNQKSQQGSQTQDQGEQDQQGQQNSSGQGQEQGQGSNPGTGGGQGSSQDFNHEHNSNATETSNHSGDHDHDTDQGQAHDHAVDKDGKCKVCGGQRTFDNHDVWTDDGAEHMSDAMKKSLINRAINSAADATRNAGKLPKAIQDMIALARKKPQIPWQTLLRQFVSRLSNGELFHTKKRPSKRFGTYPGTKIRPKLKLAVAIDVSGSIIDREYEIFLNEIFAIAKHAGLVEVIEWDVSICGHYKIKGYKPNITRTGEGGTDPREAIKWVNDRRHKFDGCIFFTDGHFYMDELKDKMRIPSLFVITADGSTEACKKYRTIKLPKVESDAA